MGIFDSTIRFLSTKQKDDDDISCGDSSERRLPKLLLIILSISINKALKGLLRKVGSIFHLAKPAADPLLPLHNPASSISTQPLLLQSPPISSPTTFGDEGSECGDEVVDRVLWFEEENYSADQRDHHVVVYVQQFTRSPVCASMSDEMTRAAVFVEENNDPFLEETDANSTEEEEEEEDEVEEEEEVEGRRRRRGGGGGGEEIKRSVIEERWIKHYSSRHRILLVGEGNFSFSTCLAVAFRCAPNIIATSLDSQAFLKKHYGKALSNIEEIRSRGSKVMHGIDATTMANHQLLGQLRFDRIIFNFPYAGLSAVKNLPRQSQLEQHQRLVRQFLENAGEMISEKGEIHITHKTNGFHGEWRLVSLARGRGLRLVEAVEFNRCDYPGYHTKYGFGGDGNFNCDPSRTFKFGLQTAPL